MRCCCEGVTGGCRITLLLMIIKRTICAKPLGCLPFSPHMEWMFYLLLFWISLHVWIEVCAIKMHTKYCFVVVVFFYASIVYWQKKAALIKGIQWCTIWVTKYTTKHNIRHILATWCCMRKYIPYGNILSAQWMPRTLRMQTQLLTFDKGYAGVWLSWCDSNFLQTKGYRSS